MSKCDQEQRRRIAIIGAGITGLWQALVLGRRGHNVTLLERSTEPFTEAASRFAGAMLAPYCEAERATPVVTKFGLRSLQLWRETCPLVQWRGSLVLAPPRDQSELKRFARMTLGHQMIEGADIAALEGDFAGRFSRALYFKDEGHVAPGPALKFLLSELKAAGVLVRLGANAADVGRQTEQNDWVIDCRGWAARDDLTDLRAVRGEMLVLKSDEINITRTVRLLHPRFPLYMVPWGQGRFMVGATVIERPDGVPVTVRSALELLGAAYAVHPAFGEAEIIELGAGLRPAFADNVPKVVVRGRRLYVNGLFRHGFLMAPALAEVTCRYIEQGVEHAEVMIADRSER